MPNDWTCGVGGYLILHVESRDHADACAALNDLGELARPQNELAQRVLKAVLDGTSQPTMSGTVAAVLERGWVDKQPHPDDARTAVVSLTDAGRAELLRGRARIGDQVARRLAATTHTEQDVAAAVDLLRSLLGKDEQ